jgi:hypothetical protein
MSIVHEIAVRILVSRHGKGPTIKRVELYGSEWDRFMDETPISFLLGSEEIKVCGVQVVRGETVPKYERRYDPRPWTYPMGKGWWE